MKSLIIGLVLCLGINSVIYAQTSSQSIEIKVTNHLADPIENASVEIYSLNGKNLITTSTTNQQGVAYLTDLANGDYKLIVYKPGYDDVIQPFVINGPITKTISLNSVKEKKETAMEDVVVRAEASSYRTEIDKRVVNVGKDLISAGATAADVLNNVPSMSVDGQSGELSLRGNENVKVFIDGKPSNVSSAQILKQIPSNSINRIEIITNPSAKYNPDGNSGIVNIITNKQKRQGYNMNIDMGWTQGRKSRHNAGISANYNIGKLNFFGNYNANLGKNEFLGEINNYSLQFNNDFSLLSDNTSQLYKFGIDWFINDKTALTVYTNQNFYGEISHATFWFDDYLNQVNQLNQTFGNGDNHNQDYVLNFKKDFNKEGSFIELDGIYSIRNNYDINNYENETTYDKYFYEQVYNDESNIQLDLNYTNPIEKFGKIEAGLQFREEKIDNQFLTDQIVEEDSDIFAVDNIEFEWSRQIYSAFINYNKEFGKLGVQLGLRGENVQEKADFISFTSATYQSVPYKNDYTEFYPSAFLTYKISEKNELLLNYSRRVDRPFVTQISPIREWNAPLITSVGNPDLKPQFTDSYELGYLYTFKKGNINASVFYRHIKDNIMRFLESDPVNPRRTILQYTNYDDTNAYGFEVTSSYKPTKWWNFNLSFDIYKNTILSDDIEVKATPWNLRLNQNFKITKDLSLQNFIMYRGENKFLQGEMHAMWKMDLGLRWTFMEGKASFTAKMSDIFKTMFAEVDINNPNISHGKFQWEAQTFYLGFNYNFGKTVKTRADKQNKANQQQGGGGVGF